MEPTESQSPQAATPQTTAQKVLETLAYPIAIVTGLFYGHRFTRNALYDTLKRRGAFEQETSQLNQAIGSLLKEPEPFLKGKLRPESIKFSKNVTQNLKSLGFKNTLDYFRELHPNEQVEALAIGFSTATVALGAIYTITQNQSIMDKIGNLTRKKQETAENAR